MKSLCKSLFKNKCYLLTNSFKSPSFQLKADKLFFKNNCLKYFSLTNCSGISNPINSKPPSNRNRSEYNNDTIVEFLELSKKGHKVIFKNGDTYEAEYCSDSIFSVDITKANGVKLNGITVRIFRNINRYNPEFIGPFLPKISSTKKYTLVLDLDNTLINCNYPYKIENLTLRPHLDTFLDKMSKHFEIVIFTAATQVYADKMLDVIDKGRISHRLYREHNTYLFKNNYLKDLSLLRRDLKHVILIDDTPSNFIKQPNNGVKVSFYNNKKEDEELLKLCSELERVVALEPDDIRLHIDEIREKVGHILIFQEESDEYYNYRLRGG